MVSKEAQPSTEMLRYRNSQTIFPLPSGLQSLKEGSQSNFKAVLPLLVTVLTGSATLQKHVAGGMRKRCKLVHRFYSLLKKSIHLGPNILLPSMTAQLKMACAIILNVPKSHLKVVSAPVVCSLFQVKYLFSPMCPHSHCRPGKGLGLRCIWGEFTQPPSVQSV